MCDLIVLFVIVILRFTVTAIYTFSGFINIYFLDFVFLLWRNEVGQETVFGLTSAYFLTILGL